MHEGPRKLWQNVHALDLDSSTSCDVMRDALSNGWFSSGSLCIVHNLWRLVGIAESELQLSQGFYASFTFCDVLSWIYTILTCSILPALGHSILDCQDHGMLIRLALGSFFEKASSSDSIYFGSFYDQNNDQN